MSNTLSLRIFPRVHEGFTVIQSTSFDDLTPEQRELLDRPLSELKLPLRTLNMLEDATTACPTPPVHTVGELLQLTEAQLLMRPNLGQKTLQNIYEALARHGFFHKGYVVSEEARSKERTRIRQDELARRLGFENYDDDEAAQFGASATM